MEQKFTKPTAQADETVVITAIDKALSASATCPVVYDGLYGHSLADLDIMDVVANLFDDTAELMAQCQRGLLFGDRMRAGWYEIGAPEVFMEICNSQSGYYNHFN